MTKRQITGVEHDQLHLLRSLADELKLPLLQIARAAELQKQLDIETTATNALRLIDGYMLVTKLGMQQQLDLSPVSVSAMLYEVAQDLGKLAKLYDTDLTIRVIGSPGRVMAHSAALRAGLIGLAYTLMTGGMKAPHQVVTMWARQDKTGVSAGVLSNYAQLSHDDLVAARRLYGRALQPAGGITQNSGAGLYIADNLFAAMNTSLRVIKAEQQTGIVATLIPSQQLALL